MPEKFRFNDSTEEIHQRKTSQMGGYEYHYIGSYLQFDIDSSFSDEKKVDRVEIRLIELEQSNDEGF